MLETATGCDDSDGGGGHPSAKFDVTNELEELDKDLAFLQFIQSDEINNVEQFVAVSSHNYKCFCDAQNVVKLNGFGD